MSTRKKVLTVAAIAFIAAVLTFGIVNVQAARQHATSEAAVTSPATITSGAPRETVTMPALPPVTATITVTVAPPAPPAAASIGEGIYKVGDAIPAGRYKTEGASSCYYARLKNDSGDFSAIIANNNLTGPGSTTLKAGEYFEISGGCKWTVVK
jgi:hypothetical protein